MDMNDYLSLFIDESQEHLQALNENMLLLEQQPDDVSIVQEMFRSAHTLKGMSATMGYESISSLTHQMENVLDLVRNGKLNMTDSIVEVLFRCLDALEAMLSDIMEGGSGNLDVGSIAAELESIVNGGSVASSAPSAQKAASPEQGPRASRIAAQLDEYQRTVLIQSLENGLHAYGLEVNIQQSCVMKAVRAYMVFDALGNIGEVLMSSPPAEEIEADKFEFSFSLLLITEAEASKVQETVMNISEIESCHVQPLTSAELAAPSADAEPAVQEAAAAAAQEKPEAKAQTQTEASKPAAKRERKPAATHTIRVDIEKLDTLMNLFSEMLIDRVRLEQLAHEINQPDFIETVEHLNRVSSNLQNAVMSLRMMPVESVFNRFPRMVRDVSKSLNKKVNLIITGADTELDRTVIDEIGDPLVHLLRNSVDHGVETPEERIRAGKPETGTIYLRAFQSGNSVIIETEDDGKGIQRDKILNKAIQKGIVTAEQGAVMADEEVYQLLFESGFSTAEKVSDISGRGVGLDVVKSKIASLGGQVSVSSSPGKGTKFTIQLPLTLSIIAAMLIRLGKETYAIPLSSIEETAIIKREQVKNIHGTLMFEYRSGMIPLISLSRFFQVADFDEQQEDETEVVIVRKGEKVAGVAVDDLIGQQEIVLKPLGSYLGNVPAVSGATILGDGQVALIIDHNALIK